MFPLFKDLRKKGIRNPQSRVKKGLFWKRKSDSFKNTQNPSNSDMNGS
jgi:hypothetical protein